MTHESGLGGARTIVVDVSANLLLCDDGRFETGGVFAEMMAISVLVDVGSCTNTGSRTTIDVEERLSSGFRTDLSIDEVVRALGKGGSRCEFRTSAEPESRMTGFGPGSSSVLSRVCVRRFLRAQKSVIAIIARTTKPPMTPPMILPRFVLYHNIISMPHCET